MIDLNIIFIYGALAGIAVLIFLLALLLFKFSEIKEARNNKMLAEADSTELKKDNKADQKNHTSVKTSAAKDKKLPDATAEGKSGNRNNKRKEVKNKKTTVSENDRSADDTKQIKNKSGIEKKQNKESRSKIQNNNAEKPDPKEIEIKRTEVKESSDEHEDLNEKKSAEMTGAEEETAAPDEKAKEEITYDLLPVRSYIASSSVFLGREQELTKICRMLLPESAVEVEDVTKEENDHAAKEAFVKAFLAKADAESDNIFINEDKNDSDTDIKEEEKEDLPTNILIYGLPGSGKTEIVSRIAERARKWGWSVYYFAFHESFARTCTDSVLDEWLSFRQNTAPKEGGQDECPVDVMHQQITRQWQQKMPARTLFIFDDVDNFEGVEELLQLPFRFVFTADSPDKVPDLPGIYKHELKWLDEWYSMRLCEIYYHGNNQGRFSAYNRSCMTAIIYLANGHPLTLELLARTCSNANINPHTLLNSLRDKGFNLREDSRKMSYEEFRQQMSLLYEITNISQMRGAEEILLQMSVLNSERCLLTEFNSLLEIEDESQLKKLSALGWVRIDNDEDGSPTAVMNKALRCIIQDCLHPQSDDVREMSVRVIAGMDAANSAADSSTALMLRQAESILRNCSGSSGVLGDMAYRAAELRYLQGDFERAFVLFRKALLLRNNIFGEYNADTANCYERLGDLYQRQGYPDEAIIMFRKVIKIRDDVGCWNDIQSKILTYKNTVALLESKKNNRAALDTYLQLLDALEKEDKSSAEIDHEYANTLVQIVRLYIKLDDRINALDWRDKAFERLGPDSGRDELSLIDSFFGDNIAAEHKTENTDGESSEEEQTSENEGPIEEAAEDGHPGKMDNAMNEK